MNYTVKDKQKYIVRTDSMGVYYAEVEDHDEVTRHATLRNARLIHYWTKATATMGIAMSGVSQDSRVTAPVDSLRVAGVGAVIPCTDKAVESLEGVPAWTV